MYLFLRADGGFLKAPHEPLSQLVQEYRPESPPRTPQPTRPGIPPRKPPRARLPRLVAVLLARYARSCGPYFVGVRRARGPFHSRPGAGRAGQFLRLDGPGVPGAGRDVDSLQPDGPTSCCARQPHPPQPIHSFAPAALTPSSLAHALLARAPTAVDSVTWRTVGTVAGASASALRSSSPSKRNPESAFEPAQASRANARLPEMFSM